jgi:hypothetical protein
MYESTSAAEPVDCVAALQAAATPASPLTFNPLAPLVSGFNAPYAKAFTGVFANGTISLLLVFVSSANTIGETLPAARYLPSTV